MACVRYLRCSYQDDREVGGGGSSAYTVYIYIYIYISKHPGETLAWLGPQHPGRATVAFNHGVVHYIYR